MKFTVYDITPVTKPRMTQRDKWKKRPCVVKYHSFRDIVKLNKINLPESGYHVLFLIQMPKGWSNTKKNLIRHQEHQSTPDKDNLEKSLLDSVFKQDSHIWDGRVSKIWGDTGKIIIITEIETDWIKTFLDETLLCQNIDNK